MIKLNFFFRNETIFPVVSNLCKSIISRQSSEWLGVLPLIHFIKVPMFTFRQPYSFSSSPTVKNVANTLFCGLISGEKDYYPALRY